MPGLPGAVGAFVGALPGVDPLVPGEPRNLAKAFPADGALEGALGCVGALVGDEGGAGPRGPPTVGALALVGLAGLDPLGAVAEALGTLGTAVGRSPTGTRWWGTRWELTRNPFPQAGHL